MDSEITLVTCFIDIGRGDWKTGFKRDNQVYFNNAVRVLNLPHPMVIFTQPEYVDRIREMRSKYASNQTRVVVREFNQLKYAERVDLIESIMKKNLDLRPRNFRRCPEFYDPKYFILIHNKIHLLKEVAEKNYFNSRYFQWIDFGLHVDVCPELPKFEIDLYQPGRLRLVSFREPKKMEHLIEYYKNFTPSVSAGLFGGDLEVIRKLTPMMNEQVEFLLKFGYTNSEQRVFYYLMCNFPELFNYRVWDDWDKICSQYFIV